MQCCTQESVPLQAYYRSGMSSFGSTIPVPSIPPGRVGASVFGPSAMLSYFAQGTARAFDHCTLVHALWKVFAEMEIGVWIERIPTKMNIADNPSRQIAVTFCWCSFLYLCVHSCREDYKVLEQLGARRVKASLLDVFMESQTWDQLSVAKTKTFKRR